MKESPEPPACVSWSLLPLMLLEGVLATLILWRTLHQLKWQSHPRRVVFHAVRTLHFTVHEEELRAKANGDCLMQMLLLSCGLRWVLWFGFCRLEIFAVGLAFAWWSNSLLLLCTALIIFQWSSAVSAGHVNAREMQRSKRFSLLHPLVFLHSVHLGMAIGGGIDLMVRGVSSLDEVLGEAGHPRMFLWIFRLVNTATVTVDAVVTCVVALQLRRRLLAAAMSDEMKKKSVIQMTLLILLITSALALQAIMDLPVLVVGMRRAWKPLSFESFCVIKYFSSGLLLSASFLYIMRRVEQREPARLMVMPTRSLVEFEECSSPCMWCDHHRRFHTGKNTWDVTFVSNFSPQTADSSFRSAQSSTGIHVPPMNDSWPPPPPPQPPGVGNGASSGPTPSNHHHHHHHRHRHHPLPHVQTPPLPTHENYYSQNDYSRAPYS